MARQIAMATAKPSMINLMIMPKTLPLRGASRIGPPGESGVGDSSDSRTFSAC